MAQRLIDNSAELSNIICPNDPNYAKAKELIEACGTEISRFQLEALFISYIGVNRLNSQSLISRLIVAGKARHIKVLEDL